MSESGLSPETDHTDPYCVTHCVPGHRHSQCACDCGHRAAETDECDCGTPGGKCAAIANPEDCSARVVAIAHRVSLGSNGTAPGRRAAFWCPGCKTAHSITVESPDGWGWNGDLVRPTFTPSVFVHSHKTLDDAGEVVDTPDCHSFVTDGSIQFLSDCTHALAGQTVELPAWRGYPWDEKEQT